MVRFEVNEYHPHKDCTARGPMDFPPVHYYQSTCTACNVEDFLENGEFAKWIFTIHAIIKEPDDNMRRTDEFMFWRDWFKDLQKGAFEPPKKKGV